MNVKQTFRSAFSLVELLVVISIIALLAGILLPALSAARLHGKQVACLANLRTVGQTMTMYLDHFGPTYPDLDGFPMGPQFNLLPDAAQDITQHTGCLPLSFHSILPGTPTRISEVWYCPVKGAVPWPGGLRRYGHGTYPWNAGALRGKNTWQIKNPPRTGLVRDFVALDKISDPTWPGGYVDGLSRELCFGPAHRNGQNILYIDAHAEFDNRSDWLNWGSARDPVFPQ
jgi:prepilin-type N-terminal cleavage/methylation domain-containing protein